jgi:hydrogenase maturation protein HypF
VTTAEGSNEGRRVRVRIRGSVQGVGFRPFVHTLAARHRLAGFVLNDGDGVLAEVEGFGVAPFLGALEQETPSLARIDHVEVTGLPWEGEHGFTIRESVARGGGSAIIVPDSATCASCLEDLFDPESRFYLYPFVTCTQCGPRFTIVHRLPYDRPNTSMSSFTMCPACVRDYESPEGRRLHAETIACAACGPRLSHSVEDIATALQHGQVVALKGLGAYHLFCDAKNEAAVSRLRARKRRPSRPLAVMTASVASVTLFAAPTADELGLLTHAARPIVLCRGGETLAPSVAPRMNRIGLMLPSVPLHHLLFHALAPGAVLVATSANVSGEPPVIDDAEAIHTLSDVADLVVTHNRPIVVRADDSVTAVIDGAPRMIRRSRGFVPQPIGLQEEGGVVLAVGAHLKATLCVTRGREAFVSQHVGDLGSAGAVRFYESTARELIAMLGVAPELVICDLHPDFRSTHFALETGLPVLQVQHHAAHVAAVAAEHHLRGPVLGVALDGYGYGDDGSAWGGELIVLDGAKWTRLGHLAPLALPGGDRAAREPWRMGVAALFALGRVSEAARRFPGIERASRLSAAPLAIGLSPSTTSLGRWFDAAAALLGVCTEQTYEGQAAMELEALVQTPQAMPHGYRIQDHVLDLRPLLTRLLEPGTTPRQGAELFHGTLIAGLADWIEQAADALGQTHVALAGGCLMNKVLAEGLAATLRARSMIPWLPLAVPANDGGLALGQAAMGRAHLRAMRS